MNETTSSFKFETIDNEPQTNLKKWYADPAMIGRHFVVYSVQDPTVKRHYTICSTMNAQLSQEIIALADCVTIGQDSKFDMSLLSQRDTSQFNLTLKNYEFKTGLSTKIHSTHIDPELVQKDKEAAYSMSNTLPTDNAYFIKGPMGRGLQLQSSGIHVAFCAGTGVLVFLDLVSSLIIKNCFGHEGRKLPEGLDFFEDSFEFHLYVSFADKESAIGLDIIEKLETLNRQLKLTNFKATVRLSNGEGKQKQRWDQNYIRKEMMPYAGKIQKVWVCGPPMLNETFDKALAHMSETLGLKSGSIEIM